MLRPACVVDFVGSTSHCQGCKRWLGGHVAAARKTCVRCGVVAWCARCKANSSAFSSHGRHECVALAAPALEIDAGGTEPTATAALAATTRPLMSLLVRWACRSTGGGEGEGEGEGKGEPAPKQVFEVKVSR